MARIYIIPHTQKRWQPYPPHKIEKPNVDEVIVFSIGRRLA